MIAGIDRQEVASYRAEQAASAAHASFLRRHGAIIAIVGLFLLLGILYGVADPIFEASDELNHYPFVQHLAQGGGLPVQRRGEATLWGQEGSQPPLYYALGAALTGWIDAQDLPALLYLNPHARRGVPTAHDNKNMIIHTDREAFPWHGTTLAVHLLRLFSVLLGACTVICTYCIALDIYPRRPALAAGAAAVNAFIPMFLFISASVNNDNLVIFLSALALLLLVRLLNKPEMLRSRLYLLGLGFVLGLACLSKLTALGLLPLAALALAWARVESGHLLPLPLGCEAGAEDSSSRLPWVPRGKSIGFWSQFWAWVIDCLFVFVPVVFVAGWWYLRNWQLYGDPTGMTAMLNVAGHRKVPPTLSTFLDEFQGFRINFWGLFGGVNVLAAPDWVYQILDALSLVALAGLVYRLVRARQRRRFGPWPALLLLFFWIVIVMVALLRWTTLTAASQGRLLFPALPALCLFFVLGLTAWVPVRWQGRAVLLGCGLLFGLAAIVPFTALMPAYPRPVVIAASGIPESARPANLVFGDAIRLIAYEVDKNEVHPGGTLGVTLYLEALKPIPEDLSLSLSVLSAGQKTLSSLDTFPSGGAYPTHLWSPGQIVRDSYVLDVNEKALGPTVAWLMPGIYRLASLTPLPVAGEDGKLVAFPALARLRVSAPTATLLPAHPLDANFGGQLRLMGYDLPGDHLQPGGKLPLKFYWEVKGKLDKDYKLFVHLQDDREEMAGQGDTEPFGGFYPTSQWGVGEILDTGVAVEVKPGLAPGAYRVVAGLYDPKTGERLPVLGAQGNPSTDHVVVTTLNYP